MKKTLFVLLAVLNTAVLFGGESHSAKGLVSKWLFDSAHLQNNLEIKDIAGTNDGRLVNNPSFTKYLDKYEALKVGKNVNKIKLSADDAIANFPKKEITLEAVVKITTSVEQSGIISYGKHKDGYEKGWVLGFGHRNFGFVFSADGISDGNGKMSMIVTDVVNLSKWYHVAATYNGKKMCLYVNGKLCDESSRQFGDILYPENSSFEIGNYGYEGTDLAMEGEIYEAAIYNRALSNEELKQNSESYKELLYMESNLSEDAPAFLVKPYLQFATKTGIKILWETNKEATTVVEYAEEKLPFDKKEIIAGSTTYHEAELKNLKPETNYFYKVVSVASDGTKLESDTLTFKTAVKDNTPFAFAVFGDTQNNPEIWGKLAGYAWNERPNFALHCGDIVGHGNNKREWVEEFLAPGNIFMSRYPVYSVLGNHEGDSKYYYDYMANPAPEYRYTFTYGNSQFFMLDTKREMKKGSEQYYWLEQELAKSKAVWKFVVHHYPPYSSDENDYGDTYKEKSDLGDMDLQDVVKLYEKYKVDMVFYGHIHDYERTWPIKNNKIEKGGVIYLQTGGAGGGLENYAPTRSWFTAKVRRDHHFCYITINGNTLVLNAIDQNRILFDYLEIKK